MCPPYDTSEIKLDDALNFPIVTAGRIDWSGDCVDEETWSLVGTSSPPVFKPSAIVCLNALLSESSCILVSSPS